MGKTAALSISFALIIVLSTALARTENQRYALFNRMCIDPVTSLSDSTCLKNIETRTGWWWHLYYGLQQ
jgi:hypothetical protein